MDSISGRDIAYVSQPEIALWKRIKSGGLQAEVETGPERHGSGPGEILLKAGEEITESALAAAEEGMRVPRLWCPDSGGRIGRQGVALQHDDLFEIVGERPRRRQAAHARTDHHRLPADQRERHRCLREFPAQSLTTRLLGLVLIAAPNRALDLVQPVPVRGP